MVGTRLGSRALGKYLCLHIFRVPYASLRPDPHERVFRCNIKFCGSHAGVSIGEDGVSQMGLEDISDVPHGACSTVVYPSDAVSTERLVASLAQHKGIAYIRTTRMDTPILYGPKDTFKIGGSKTLRSSKHDGGYGHRRRCHFARSIEGIRCVAEKRYQYPRDRPL